MGKDWNEIISDCYSGADKVATLKCLPAVFQNLVTAALLFAGIIALFFIILGGIKLILSQGDPKQIEGARHTLTYAIIGLLLILLSFLILNIVSHTTRVDCILKFGFENCK